MSPTLTVPRSALSIPNPYAGDPASVSRGKAVYQQHCQACHGIDGDGRGPAGANLRIHPPSFHNPQHFLAPGMDGAHFWVVQHGDGQPGGMPAWQGTLTDQQIWDVINYVKQIAAGTANTTQTPSTPAPAAPASITPNSASSAPAASAPAPAIASPTSPKEAAACKVAGSPPAGIQSPPALVDGLCVSLAIDPGQIGPSVTQTQTVTLSTPAGAPIDDAEVALFEDMMVHEMSVTQQRMKPIGNGRYTMQGSIFSMEGDWDMQVLIGRQGATSRAVFHVLAGRDQRLAFSTQPGQAPDLGPAPGLDLKGPPSATVPFGSGSLRIELYPELTSVISRQAADLQFTSAAGAPIDQQRVTVRVDGGSEVEAEPAGPGRYLAELGPVFRQGDAWQLTIAAGNQHQTLHVRGERQGQYTALRFG